MATIFAPRAQKDPRERLSFTALREAANATDALEQEQLERDIEQQRQKGRFDTFGRRSMNRLNQAKIAQSPWREFFQATKHVDRFRTGAAAGFEQPGFLDGAPSIAAMQQRANHLDASDANSRAASFQNFRRLF